VSRAAVNPMEEIVIGGKNIQSNIKEKQNPAAKRQGFLKIELTY
jgi:hypothetical protein